MSRILIVEDEPAIALGLEDDLKMEGYEVEVASDGITGARRGAGGRVRSGSAGRDAARARTASRSAASCGAPA